MRMITRLALVAALVAFATVLVPAAPAAATTPTASSPQPIRFTAGPHSGYRLDAAGPVLVKTATLVRPSGATTTQRRAAFGSTWLRVSNGLFAGLWVKEGALRYVPGEVGTTVWSPARSQFFRGEAAGRTFIGYRFDSLGRLTGTKSRTLYTLSSAHADRAATINGRAYSRIVDGIWAGYWIPTEYTNPVPIKCQAGNRPVTATQQSLTTVAGAGPEVALTFDMGGRLTPARAILQYLLLERVCTTVFPTGAAVQTTEGLAAMAIVKANPALFEVGNHTMHHCNLRDGGGGAACPSTRPTSAFVTRELTDAAAVIRAASGQSPLPYWRPPYGAVDATLRSVAAAAGYTKTVMWAVDTIDWRPVADGGPTALDIARKLRAMPSGGIALMHLGGYNTLDGLPYALAGLRSRGLTSTSISDLLR